MTTTFVRNPLAQTTTQPSASSFSLAALRDWTLKRGVLYALLQAPIASILLGTVFHFLTPAMAIFAYLISFAVLPVWVAYRISVSDDPEEPARHLHRYALYALMPVVLFSLTRIPAFLLFDFVYWNPWFIFGSGLTAEPYGHFSSLIPGSLLYCFQGYALGIGFFALFKRPTFVNGFLYFGGFIGTLYSYVFPEYLLVGSRPGVVFHTVNWVAHVMMGVAVWAMPRFWNQTWPSLAAGGRTLALAALVAISAAPFVFAYGGAAFWQFDAQREIDEKLFNRANLLSLHAGPTRTADGPEARYEYTLRFGPRSFSNAAHVARALDAGPIEITGRLVAQGQPIAWCAAYVHQLPTPNKVTDPVAFFPELRRLDHVDIPVTCHGPNQTLAAGAPITVQWSAEARLIGDRETQTRRLTGDQPAPLQVTVANH